MNQKKYAFSDMPAENDTLGLERYYTGLANFIRECPTSMTIAIQGGWGCGKTTAMQIIQNHLKEEMGKDRKKLIQINFNTWQYSKVAGDNLFLPLLKRMTEKVHEEIKEMIKNDDQMKKAFEKEFKNKEFVERILGATALTGKAAINVISEINPFMKVLDVVPDIFKAKGGSDIPDASISIYGCIEELKDALDKYIEFLERIGINRIVFYVDDLDRLRPEEAVSFLEDLKNFFECKNCVFVLALDHELVRRGLRNKYHFEYKPEEEEEYASRFFDKLIQLPFNIPTYKYDVKAYVENLIGDNGNTKEYIDIFKEFGDTNPRAIKRAFNVFGMYKDIPEQSYSGHDIELLALLVLQMNHEKLYKKLLMAIRKDSPVYMFKIFYKDDIRYENIDKWFTPEKEEGDDEDSYALDCAIVRKIKELFFKDGKKADGYQLLRDLVGATSLTGSGFADKQQEVSATMELVDVYLRHLGYTFICSDENSKEYTINDIKVKIIDFGGDHVNLNIYTEILQHKTRAEKELFFFGNNRFNIEEIPLQTENEQTNNGKDKKKKIPNDTMVIMYNFNDMCCFRGISIKQPLSMYSTGRILRNIAATGEFWEKD